MSLQGLHRVEYGPELTVISTVRARGSVKWETAMASSNAKLSARVFDIRNNCPFTVWAAAVPGGGQRLDYGGTWRINASKGVRIWGRTNCNFDISTGRGHCQTGDCNGLLQCQTYGKPPNTLAEYSLNQFNISLVNGFNIPMKLIPTLIDRCSHDSISCTADITGQCPKELRTPGGCNDPCTVFNTDEYCCTSGNCGETNYSRFFKERCPNSFSYPRDEAVNSLICPRTTNYRVVFCP